MSFFPPDMHKRQLEINAAADSSNSSSSPLENLPVHEYWLEHKRAMNLELASQRSAMLYEISSSQQSALLGIELVRSKLEDDIATFYKEFRNVLTAVQSSLDDGWRKIQAREKSLLSLQLQLNDSLGINLRAAKEQVMRNAELETSYQERKEQLEEWAQNCQNIILKREEELSATARKLDSDMSAIMVARKRLQTYDREVSARPGTVARIVTVPKATSTSVEGEDDVYQVPVGESFDLKFRLQMSDCPPTADRRTFPKIKDFENVPVTLSYIEGKGGQIWGTVQALVGEGGKIELNGVRIEAKGGSSHILLVSMPKTIFGNVHPIEVRIHVYSVPKIDVIGAWKPDARALVGRVRLRHAEPFSVANMKMSLGLIIHRGGATTSTNNNNNNNNNISNADGNLRSVSASSTQTGASFTSMSNNTTANGGRIFRAEAEGDGQNDFAFNIALPNHVWEELESSTLVLEFRTPNLTVFPALEHKFEVDWLRVDAASNAGETDRAEGKTSVKLPMFRHGPGSGGASAEPLTVLPAFSQFPKSDLITDFAISDSGNLLLLVEVNGTASLYRYDFPQKWVLSRRMILPYDDTHIGGASFSRSGNLFALHDTASKKIYVYKVAKVLKTAPPTNKEEAMELSEDCEFVVDYCRALLPKDKDGKSILPHGNTHLSSDALLATHFKPIEDVLGASLVVQIPALGLHLFNSEKSKRPSLLVDPRGQNTVRMLYHKVLPNVGSVAVLGFDNGEVVVTATNATKATGKRVQFRFSVVKGSPVVGFSDGPTPSSFLVVTICSVCIVKTQPTWSVMRSSFVTSSPISCVAFGLIPKGVVVDEEEQDGVALVCHNNGLMAAVGIVSGSILGSVMLPEVGENHRVPTIANAQCVDAGELGIRIVSSTSLKPAGWEVKLVSLSGEAGSVPPVPVSFTKHVEKQNEQQGGDDDDDDEESDEK